jgi:hypothetical protein
MKNKAKVMMDCCRPNTSSNQPIYGLGLIGAMIFYISHATTFTEGLVGFFKALVWPAILVYEALKLFGA